MDELERIITHLEYAIEEDRAQAEQYLRAQATALRIAHEYNDTFRAQLTAMEQEVARLKEDCGHWQQKYVWRDEAYRTLQGLREMRRLSIMHRVT